MEWAGLTRGYFWSAFPVTSRGDAGVDRMRNWGKGKRVVMSGGGHADAKNLVLGARCTFTKLHLGHWRRELNVRLGSADALG